MVNMRSLMKNQQKLYYATYYGQITEYYRDSDGNIIYDEIDGEQIPRIKCERAWYNNPVPFDINVSAGKGTSQEEVFGVSLDYTKIISTTDMSLTLDEKSLVWFETEPTYNADGTVNEASADYSVVGIAKSLNNVVYALKKRAKDGG